MPEFPAPKPRPHPWARNPSSRPARSDGANGDYAELHVTTNFTFLAGASHPDELVEQAAQLGYRAIAIADRNSLGGVVRAHVAAKEAGLPLVVGCLVDLESPRADDRSGAGDRDAADAQQLTSPTSIIECDVGETIATRGSARAPRHSVLVYPTTRAAYGRLCTLLTIGKRRAPKGECHLTVHDLVEHHDDLLAVYVPPEVIDQPALEMLEGLRRVFGDDRLSIAASFSYGPDDSGRLDSLTALAQHVGAPLVATNDVRAHVPERRALLDVLTAVRHGCSVQTAGFRLLPNAERHLKAPAEMARLFALFPEAIARSVEIAERASSFSLDELRYEYPDEICPPGCAPIEHLADLTWQGARERYPDGVPGGVVNQIDHELRLIGELRYAPYFLTVHDLVVFARSRSILCQGRGAAANSAVCYCLGVTAVDPARIDLLFERFVSRERDEPPDIDIDFAHERREEVIQYVYRKYGRDRAALTAEIITYRGRSAVRDVGKALGLSLDAVDRLAKNIDWWHDGVGDAESLRALGFDPADPLVRKLLELCETILGFPRHRSQHVGGFVITRRPLSELVPIENAAMEDRTVIEWDKDDIDAMGMLKVDVLGLGMLTCIDKAFALIGDDQPGRAHGDARGDRGLSLHTIPPEDPAVYDMICAADTIGVFQIESRAQMSMLPRLRPRSFYDLVIEVAIVRPGPIQGDMVHPYLRRRSGEEPVTYPDERVRRILAKTLGVPLFQEQAMSLAIAAAGFTPGEADQLRRAMAAWRRSSQIERFRDRFMSGMRERGYDLDFAERCFRQIEGFSEYGFPESHAASFALLVYVSAWLKRYHPAAFAAALINSQPMGFYAPAQIVACTRAHGVEVRAIDVNVSEWDCALESAGGTDSARTGAETAAPIEAGPSLRLGMRLIKGLARDEAERIARAVKTHGPFASIEALRRASEASLVALRRLAAADAFGSMGLDRQRALWTIRALHDEALPLFEAEKRGLTPFSDGENEDGRGWEGEGERLPPISPAKLVAQDYAAMHLSLKAHPVSFLREILERMDVTRAAELRDVRLWPQGKRVAVAGLVLVRQRPSTAGGLLFMTLEDETGIANLIVRPEIYERYRPIARHGVAILARGRLERQKEVVHVQVDRFESLDGHLAITAGSRDFR